MRQRAKIKMFPFICFDTEDDSEELTKRVRAGEKGVSMFNKKVTQIAAITANGKRFYSPGNIKTFWNGCERKAKPLCARQDGTFATFTR
jgi:hypothetical protein